MLNVIHNKNFVEKKDYDLKPIICNTILQEIKPYLNNEQAIKLQEILIATFKNIDFEEKHHFLNLDYKKENENLIKEFIAAKSIEGCSKNTLKYYKDTISNIVNKIDKSIKRIETDDVRNYLIEFQETRNSSRVTIDNMRRIYSSFWGWLEDEEYILKSPIRRIHKVKISKVIKETYTDEEIVLLRDNVKNKRDLAIIDLLISTGMRIGELVLLNREDINFYEREVIVFGKGSKERVVYFDAETKLHLQAYLEERTDKNRALFVSNKAPFKRLQISGIEVLLRSYGEKLGINKVHPHKFRRTLATNAIDKGMPIEQLQKLLGHEKIDTTLHYAMVKQSNVKNSHRKYLG